MPDRRLFVLAGHPGDGKSTVANYLSSRYGIPTYEFGQLIRDEATSRGLEPPLRATAMSFLRNTLDVEYGPGALVEPIIRSDTDLVASGLRRMHEYRQILRVEPNAIFIAITTPDIEERYARIVSDAMRADRPCVDFDTFLADTIREARNSDPMESSVDDVIERADFTIENTGTLEDLYQSVDTLMQVIGVERPSQQR